MELLIALLIVLVCLVIINYMPLDPQGKNVAYIAVLILIVVFLVFGRGLV